MSEGREIMKSNNALAEVGKNDLKPYEVPALYKPNGGGFDTKSRFALGLIALSLFASLFIRVDQVVTAPGKVIPSTRVKSIQHLEGGIVQDLAVKEGDLVKEGSMLVQLNLATSGINIEELKSRRAALEMSRARLLGEASGKVPE